ncbi:transcriptional repressor LexA [Patescibacteria group bacterium]|nr:transcriptional repressor LexA [Patescibacteria group bacterium]MBU1931628.1 transcriptional repressor LexA [Patescibacteria group bacterium]
MPVVLYKKQKQIFDYIQQYIQRRGFAPTLREVADVMGLSSLSTVHEHISRLVEKGVMRRYVGSRGMEIVEEAAGRDEASISLSVIGYISAGLPLEPYRTSNMSFQVAPHMVSGKHRSYILQVRGDSMIEDGILDGDYVVVEEVIEVMNGEIVVALLENGTAVLKRYFKEATRVRLEPANANMGPIYALNVQIQGRVVGVIRKFYN